MKFLVDNQLPQALAAYLAARGVDCQHVIEIGLAQVSDAGVCRYATAQNRVIITKDEDFFHLANEPKATFILIWVRLGNCRNEALLAAFEELWPRIEADLRSGNRIIEIR